MKRLNIKKTFFIFLFILSFGNKAQADCFTGFACSVSDLEKQEHEKLLKNIEIYKQYLQESKKDIVLTIDSNHFNYKDLFIFSSFV